MEKSNVRGKGLSVIVMAGLMASPAMVSGQDRPLTDNDPRNVEDVARSPVNDLNVGRDDEIPPLLVEAVADPYNMNGLTRCSQIKAAVEALDGALGPDIDLPKEERDRISGGRVAKWVVSSFIPFRGLIREVTGANDKDREVLEAIRAGLTRRGFLKGMGVAKGCSYPARPAPPEVVAARLEALEQAKQDDDKDDKKD